MVNMDLGTRIGAWLKAQGWSQRGFAGALEMSVGAVNGWVNNDFEPSQQNLRKIVEMLDLTMEQFYGEIPKPKKNAKTTKAAKRAVA